MVSAKTLLTGSVLIGGIAAYFALGGSEGIGRRIGGALGSFGYNLVESFKLGLPALGGNANPSTGGAPTIGPTGAVTVDGVNTLEDKIVQEGGKVESDVVPLALSFKEDVEAGRISADFARRYSFQPPAQEGQLDVSKTFDYISNVSEGNAVNFIPEKTTPYGGYGSAESQRAALVAAIERSSELYPQYFA